MNFEGLIIHKAEYKERDLICSLLLRNGKKQSFYFYGGRGGGKKAKGSFLELGHMIKVTTKPGSNKRVSDIQIASEYNLLWDSDNIRKNHLAFYFMCFVFDVIKSITVSEDIENESDEFSGIFKVVSNLLFYLDKDLKEKSFDTKQYIFNFLSKTLQELGSLPNLSNCGHCEIDLNKVSMARFETHEGHFTCIECLQAKDETLSGNLAYINELKTNIDLKNNVLTYLNAPIKDTSTLSKIDTHENELLFNYLCYQFSFNANNFKTWDMIKSI
jgi:recombinational DNA repair protein (RecF pathway)